MRTHKTMGAYWVEGIGNEVFVGVGALSVVTVLLTYTMIKAVRSRMYADREEEFVATGMAISARDSDRRGVIGDSAEPENCPICLSNPSFAVDTNCGHTFCAQCILSYWEHDQWPRPARCPVCRNQVSLLLPCAGLSDSSNPELWQLVLSYNQRMSGHPRPLVQYLYDIPMILGHVWRLFFTADGVALLCRLHILLLLALLALYILSPLDLIPEAVFGALGLLDDFIILIAVATYTSQLYRNYVTNG